MCFLCDGGTVEEHRALIGRHIDRHGWAVQHVEADPPNLPWAYTIGLTEQFDHPELVVLGLAPVPAAHLLNAMGLVVAVEHRFDDTAEAYVDLDDESEVLVGLRPVHPKHVVNGLVAAWTDYYRHAPGPRRPLPSVLQVVLPDRDHCAVHQRTQPLLDDPTSRLMTPVLNRASRRAAQRENRRRPGRAGPGR